MCNCTFRHVLRHCWIIRDDDRSIEHAPRSEVHLSPKPIDVHEATLDVHGRGRIASARRREDARPMWMRLAARVEDRLRRQMNAGWFDRSMNE